MKCIISCEHASNKVPPRFAHVFRGKEKVLFSHQAYDHGAAKLARSLAKKIDAQVYLGSISRLLIDLNRSQTNRKTLFTKYSRVLQQHDRELLVKNYYQPYRKKVEDAVEAITGMGKPVLHISVHSFAPVKKGKVRKADIGLLYDPARKYEEDLCTYIVGLLKQDEVKLRVRRNYPYLGKTDGFTSYLRRKHAAGFYVGIEVEVNQAILLKSNNKKGKAEKVLAEGLSTILQAGKFSQPIHTIS